jgi:hypothetical protein
VSPRNPAEKAHPRHGSERRRETPIIVVIDKELQTIHGEYESVAAKVSTLSYTSNTGIY